MPVDPWEAFKEKPGADPFAQYRETPNITGTPPPAENVIRPTETGPKAFLENLMSDIQSGTTITPVGRALRGMGASGTRSGVSGETGAIVGGPAEGIPRALHGFLETQQSRVGQPSQFAHGMNEIFQGVGQVAAPIAGVTQPAFLPAAAGFGVAQQSGQGVAGALGANPDTAQLIGNLTGVAAMGVPKLPELFGAKGTPAERLSVALSKTLPKEQWARVNERLAAVGDKIPEVVGGAKNVGEAAAKMKQRSLDLGRQFSDAIEPVKSNDVSSQVAKLRATLEQAATNADPYNANAYRAMGEKVSELKTLGQLDDFVSGFNKTSRFNAGPESMVRQALTETVRGITGQDFSPLRLEQSHWYTLARAAQKASIPEQLQGVQSKVTSPSRKLAQLATEVPKTSLEAILKGSKLLQPSPTSLIKSIEAPPIEPAAARPQASFPAEQLNTIREGGEGTRRSSAQFIQDVIRRQGLPTDPRLADIEAAVKGRATELRAKYGPPGQFESLQDPLSGAGSTPPPPASMTPEPYYAKYGNPQTSPSEVYTPGVLKVHGTAMDQAKAQLPNGSLSDLLQLAAKIQRGGP